MQSKTSSAVEAVSGTAIGFLVSMGILALVNLWWGLRLNLVDNVLITAIFTVASVLRSYLVRRFFNWWHHREYNTVQPVNPDDQFSTQMPLYPGQAMYIPRSLITETLKQTVEDSPVGILSGPSPGPPPSEK